MRTKRLKGIIILSLLILGCGKTERIDTKEVKEALKQREIRKITDAQITEEGLKLGEIDSKNLLDCINRGDSLSTYTSCLDSLSSGRIKSLKVLKRGEATTNLSKAEADLWGAYQYNFERKLELLNNLQDLRDGRLLFTRPLYLDSADTSRKISLKKENGQSSFAIIFIQYDKRKVILNME